MTKSVTINSVRAVAKLAWKEAGVIAAGRTHLAAADLAAALARSLRSHTQDIRLHTRVAGGSDEYALQYVITNAASKPTGRNWDRLVSLADLIAPEPGFDGAAELWAVAVQAKLVELDDVPEQYRQVVSAAQAGPPGESTSDQRASSSAPGG